MRRDRDGRWMASLSEGVLRPETGLLSSAGSTVGLSGKGSSTGSSTSGLPMAVTRALSLALGASTP